MKHVADTNQRISRWLVAAYIVLGGVTFYSQLADASTLVQTTLSATAGAGVSTFTLDDASSIQAGWWVYIDRETSLVLAVNGNVLTVQRDVAGVAADHVAGSVVYAGQPVQFQHEPPLSESCIAGNVITPYINIETSRAWTCAHNRWIELQPFAASTTGVNPWVECSGVSPARVCAVKVVDNGVTRILVTVTY